jgi:hypothetical protein
LCETHLYCDPPWNGTYGDPCNKNITDCNGNGLFFQRTCGFCTNIVTNDQVPPTPDSAPAQCSCYNTATHYGQYCDIIYPCSLNPCGANGASCVDDCGSCTAAEKIDAFYLNQASTVFTAICTCNTGYTGDTCQYEYPCFKNNGLGPCNANNTDACVDDDPYVDTSSYTCHCKDGFAGKKLFSNSFGSVLPSSM